MNKIIYRMISTIVSLVLVLGVYLNAEASPATGNMLAPKMIYVSLSGNDANSGSITSPYKTFAKAVSVLAAGDILQIMPGTYSETLTLSRSGTATAPITVVGNDAILNMQGLKANGIVVSGSYINLSSFEVIGATDFGILVTGKYVIVENNIVHDNVTKNGVGTCGSPTSWGSAVKVKVGGENTTIRNNTVYDNCGEGIAVTRGLTALVENNTVHDNFSVNIYIDNSPFVIVQNNISYCTGTHLRNGNRATGIATGEESYSGWGAQLHDIMISGNTITDCRTGIAAFDSDVNGTLKNVTITNNKVPSGQVRSISLQSTTNQNVLVSYNAIFNSIYVNNAVGVTLIGNGTSTSVPSPTNTILAPSFTPTLTLAPQTASPTPALPTSTATPIPSTATLEPSPTSVPPTVETLEPPTATVQPPVSEVIYDDTDGAFVYSPGWEDVSNRKAYNGSFKLTTQNNSFATFTFTGQSFSVLYRGGTAFRKVDVYVDDALVGTIDERTSESAFQQRWDYANQLAPGQHVLKLVFVTPNTSNKTKGSIDAVIVR